MNSTLLNILRRKPLQRAETGLQVGNLDQFLGYAFAQQFIDQLLAEMQSNTQLGSVYGKMPKSMVSDFTEPTLAYRQWETGTRQQDDLLGQRKYEFNADDAFRRLQQSEAMKNNDLDRQLTREVEAGRITQQEKDRVLAERRIASEERMNEARIGVERERVGVDRERVGVERYGVDVQKLLGQDRNRIDERLGLGRLNLDQLLGISGENRNNYLANLQGAELEADLAANPRDFIKLAFFRAGQNVPQQLQGVAGTVKGPGRFNPSPLNPVKFAKGGNVSHGPTISTVGEKDLEYALLAPGSIIAPRNPGEEPNMSNAIKALMRQVMKSGGNVEDFPLEEGLQQAEHGKVTTPEPPNWQLIQQAIQTVAAGGWNQQVSNAVNYLKRLMQQGTIPSLLGPTGLPDPSRLNTWWATNPQSAAGNNNTGGNNTGGGNTGGNNTGGGGNVPGNLDFLATLPFIERLRGYSSEQSFPGINRPFGSADPINPYNPHVGFDLAQANPTDRAMVSGYQSAFGIPEGDTEHIAAQTAQGYGLTQPNARAVFRPLFNN